MLDVFRPLIDAARGIDLADGAAAERTLRERFDPGGPEARALNGELARLLEEGRIANRGEPPVRWGRAAKAAPETEDLSIDVVDMTGAGPRHRHPNGEIDYCVALDGRPTFDGRDFDGRDGGWVVFPPGSTHVPTVAGGRMLIVYLLPAGEIEFL